MHGKGRSSGSIYTGSVLLMEAILRRRADVVDYLISNAAQLCLNLNSRDKTGSNILFYAASIGCVADLQKLIDAGCLVESDYEGRTVLMQAALSGRVDTARYLVLSAGDVGLDVEQRDALGRNALFYGVESNSLEMVEYLFSTGITCRPTEGNTILMQSSRSGNDVITRFLLDHSGQLNMGDINTVDFRGENALFYAVQSCSTSVVAMLIQSGADPLKDNFEGVNVVSYAMNNAPHWLAVSILEQTVLLDDLGNILNLTDKRDQEVIKGENIDPKSDEASDELPAMSSSPCDHHKTQACYDSDVSSRCSTSSSSSSGVCSTCSLYFNKSNCSNDELCACNDDMDNKHNKSAKLNEQFSSSTCNICSAYNNNNNNSLFYSINHETNKHLTQSRYDNQSANVKESSNRLSDCLTQDLNEFCSNNSNKIELLKQLLCSKDNRSRSLIQYLIEAGETSLIASYLKAVEGDDEFKKKLRREVDEVGCSLLMSACKHPLDEFAGKSKIKERNLIKNGLKSKRRNEIHANRLDLVKYFVEVFKIDPDGVDKANRNALFYAVESGSLQVTSYLLQKMKTIEADKTGRTILMVAVATGNQLVVSEILASKFAAELLIARDEGGRTAFHFCAMQDCSVQSAVMLDTLLKYEESLRKERHICPKMSDNNLLEPAKSNLPDSSDFEGRTPLMYACQSGNRSAVMRLLRTPHVIPDRRDVRGRTALHHCFSGSNASLFCAGSLLRRNVDVNAVDAEGVTCLMLACQTCSVTNIAVIRMLVEFGADSVLQDRQGKDSFDYCPPLNSHYVKAILKDKTCMPSSEREALWQMEQRLVGELHMNSVLRGLLKEGIFTKTLNFEVMKQPPGERIQKLIEILVTRGRLAFRKFCKVLKEEGELDISFELMKLAYVKEAELFW